MNNTLRGHLALASVALIYGANYIIAKSVMPEPIGANSFITLRVAGACLLFWLVVGKKAVLPKKEDRWRFILCALTGVATNQLFFFNGLALTSPINASIIMTSNPILVMLISAVLLKQRITWMKVLGVVIGAIGAITLLWISTHDVTKQSSVTGDIYILINSLSFAFYLVLVKPLMSKYHPFVVTAWIFTIGVFMVLPFGGLGITAVEWSVLTAWQWFCVGFVIVFTTFLSYLLNNIGIHYTSSTITSSYIYLQPILAGVFAFLFSGITEKNFASDITLIKVLCALLVFAGVFLVSKGEAKIT